MWRALLAFYLFYMRHDIVVYIILFVTLPTILHIFKNYNEFQILYSICCNNIYIIMYPFDTFIHNNDFMLQCMNYEHVPQSRYSDSLSFFLFFFNN